MAANLERHQDLAKIKATQDVLTAESIANWAIGTEYWHGGVNEEFLAETLAKQKVLGMGELNRMRWQEATDMGWVATDGKSMPTQRGDYPADEWNQNFYYLCSVQLVDYEDKEKNEFIPAQEPDEYGQEVYDALRNEEVDVDEVVVFEAPNWRESTVFESVKDPTITENPGVYRVWVKVGDRLGKKLEEMTASPTQQIKGR